MDKAKQKIAEMRGDHHHALVTSMTKRVQLIKNRPSQADPCTIYRVPKTIRQVDVDAYEPQIISIGPYHRNKRSLQAMEEYKWHSLHAILGQNPNRPLEDYIKEIQHLEARARSCYSENIDMGSNDFVEMMVLDGCFIVELLLNVNRRLASAEEMSPIYSTKWMVPLIGQDILLLENQLPFFIIQRLFDLVKTTNSSSSLPDLALEFFEYFLPRNKDIRPSKVVYHLLHLFHTHLLPTPSDRSLQVGSTNLRPPLSSRPLSFFDRDPPSPPRSIPSVTEIQRAGIKCRKKTKADSFLDVTYQNGVIYIPSLSIHDSITNTIFRNMIAFEQCRPKSGIHFTSYAIFMHCILETENDATVLKQNRIIEHWLGSDDEVVVLFNRICKGVAIDFEDNHLSNMLKHVAEVCETDWHTWRATLMRDYFHSPWSILQMEATILALVFTLVQTFLAVLAYYHPRN